MSWIVSLSCISLACMMMILYLNYVMFVKSTKRELLLSFWQWNKWFCYGVNYFLSNKRKCLSNSVIRKHKLQCKFGTTIQWGTVIACLFVFCHLPGICLFVWQTLEHFLEYSQIFYLVQLQDSYTMWFLYYHCLIDKGFFWWEGGMKSYVDSLKQPFLWLYLEWSILMKCRFSSVQMKTKGLWATGPGFQKSINLNCNGENVINVMKHYCDM